MELQTVMETAGTTRFFKPDPVPDDVLARVMDAGRFAPQGGNRQPVRFVVVKDPAKKRQLMEWYLVPWKAYVAATQTGDVRVGGADQLVRNADHFAEHLDQVPAIVVVCASLADLHPTDTELDRLSVVGGCSIYPAMQNLFLKCREEGLGAAVTTLLCAFEPQVKEMLNIPEGFVTAAHVAVGWPDRPFPKKLSRRPLAEIAFLEEFGKPFPGA